MHLSGLLFAIMLGNVLALAPVSGVLRKWGAKTAVLLSIAVMSAGLLGLAWSPSVPLAVIGLLVYGIGFGGVDLVLNATGTWLEDELQRPIMSGFHAAFSVGALVGAVTGGFFLTQGVSLGGHLGTISLLVGLVGGAFALPLPSRLTSGSTANERGRPSLLLCLILVAGFSAALCEGAVNDWAVVYLKGILDVPASAASVGFTSFAVMMVVGRVFGNRLSAALGRSRLATAAALLATVGFLALQWAGEAFFLGLMGFALVGLGLSVLAPLGFSAAWQVGQARGVALMTGIFYGGFLAGPPLVGMVVHASTLQAAFALPLLLALVSVVLAGGLKVYAEQQQDIHALA
nr:MFS transporter [Deinococcus hopiensis]